MIISKTSKSQLIASVAADTGNTKAHTETMLTAIFDHIGAGLRDGEEIRITGFGTFSTKKVLSRTGRNPRTGATLEIPAKIKPVFKASADFTAGFN